MSVGNFRMTATHTLLRWIVIKCNYTCNRFDQHPVSRSIAARQINAAHFSDFLCGGVTNWIDYSFFRTTNWDNEHFSEEDQIHANQLSYTLALQDKLRLFFDWKMWQMITIGPELLLALNHRSILMQIKWCNRYRVLHWRCFAINLLLRRP